MISDMCRNQLMCDKETRDACYKEVICDEKSIEYVALPPTRSTRPGFLFFHLPRTPLHPPRTPLHSAPTPDGFGGGGPCCTRFKTKKGTTMVHHVIGLPASTKGITKAVMGNARLFGIVNRNGICFVKLMLEKVFCAPIA